MRVLNLYAGIGGNRKLWKDCEVTACERDEEIAKVYEKLYPEDVILVGNALDVLENMYDRFDFIWASPPCPSHGQYRHNVGVKAKGYDPLIPDMSLYGIIIFLQNYAKCSWVVENVKPYYEPLVKPTVEIGRHLFWASQRIEPRQVGAAGLRTKNKIEDFAEGELLKGTKIKNKRQVLRNMVDPEVGRYVFEQVMKPPF